MGTSGTTTNKVTVEYNLGLMKLLIANSIEATFMKLKNQFYPNVGVGVRNLLSSTKKECPHLMLPNIKDHFVVEPLLL